MMEWLTAKFTPRIEPEQRVYRTQLARTINISLLILLGISSVGTAIGLIRADVRSWTQVSDLLLLLVAISLAGYSQLLLLKDDVLAAGLVLSGLVTGLVTFLVFRFPQDIYILSPLYLIPVVCTGVLIGGGGVYLSAAINLTLILLSSINARILNLEPGLMGVLPGIRFLVIHAVLLFGIAGLIESLMVNIQSSLRLLHSRTQQLSSLAHTDPLTQLANRRYLIEMLEREFSRAQRYRRHLSLVYLDLDGFKEINDKHGHLFGDELLKGAATSMKAILRATDMLARIGGDEFAILLPETDLDGAVLVTAKLRRALTAYGNQLKKNIAPLTFCSGVSSIRRGDTSIDELLSRADAAQYLAKKTGKAHTRDERELPLETD